MPIAVGVLCSIGIIKNIPTKEVAFIGELSLDGKVNTVNGVLPMCIEGKNLGIKKVIVPKENALEASIVKDIEVIGVESLKEVVNYLNKNNLRPIKSNWEEVATKFQKYNVDFSEVKGQGNIKRAVEVAAAGAHNCLLIRFATVHGKTMISKRIPTILPNLSFEEALEITKIHSIAGILPKDIPIITNRPFRAPHHTISSKSLIGGGTIPKPGEISLSHYGVLFLDELPEFSRNTLEVLRGPLEDGVVTISRVNSSFTYPCKFMFVASMNPCPCGYYGSKEKECTCTEQTIAKYMSKISGPLLDRIDIQIEVNGVKYQKLENNSNTESSKDIQKRVNMARKIQRKRYENENIYSNSELTPKLIEKYCNINEESKKILQMAFDKLGFSARAYGRILKVARTIADLDNSENITKSHITEAIQYRSLDKKYWKN